MKTFRFSISFVWLIFGTALCWVPPHTTPVQAEEMTVEEFNARLEAMENENHALRTQIQAAASKPVPSSQSSVLDPNATQEGVTQAPRLALSERDLALARAEEISAQARQEAGSSLWIATEDNLEAELARYKGWSWDKENFTITPYVWLWVSGTYETSQMQAGEYPLWVRDADEKPYSYIDVKSSRVGFNLACPEVTNLPGTKITGVFEIDFQNAYPAENKPDLELRKAYIQLQNDDYMFRFGQTWELLGEIYTPTLNWGYGSGGGNWAFRRPQARFDRYFKRENGRLALQACILGSQTASFTEAGTGTVYTGKFGSYPECQVRVERTFKETDCWYSAMFAIGAKIGEKEYVSNGDEFHRTSWGVVAESKIRFTERFYWMGEGFVGELLAINCSGIMQDINPLTRENVGSVGGWMAFGWDITPEVHYAIGYSLDNPWNKRLSEGMKALNHFAFTNISRDITKQFNIGFEYEYYETEYYKKRFAHSHLFMLNLIYKL